MAMSLVGAVVLAGGCKLNNLALGIDDGDAGPQSGMVVVSLITPNTDDGAIRLTVNGPQVNTPQSATGAYVVFSRQVSQQVVDVIVVGDLVTGALIDIPVADMNRADEYRVSVAQVADRSDTLRTSLTGYAATVTPAN